MVEHVGRRLPVLSPLQEAGACDVQAIAARRLAMRLHACLIHTAGSGTEGYRVDQAAGLRGGGDSTCVATADLHVQIDASADASATRDSDGGDPLTHAGGEGEAQLLPVVQRAYHTKTRVVVRAQRQGCLLGVHLKQAVHAVRAPARVVLDAHRAHHVARLVVVGAIAGHGGGAKDALGAQRTERPQRAQRPQRPKCRPHARHIQVRREVVGTVQPIQLVHAAVDLVWSERPLLAQRARGAIRVRAGVQAPPEGGGAHERIDPTAGDHVEPVGHRAGRERQGPLVSEGTHLAQRACRAQARVVIDVRLPKVHIPHHDVRRGPRERIPGVAPSILLVVSHGDVVERVLVVRLHAGDGFGGDDEVVGRRGRSTPQRPCRRSTGERQCKHDYSTDHDRTGERGTR
mmetsp:Transcript_26980/g.86754  ORF Transcript_26980/g.86754 Transcript_26980/m.86754 type:complete len:402 (-) Transcript_26980:29-1234(-)